MLLKSVIFSPILFLGFEINGQGIHYVMCNDEQFSDRRYLMTKALEEIHVIKRMILKVTNRRTGQEKIRGQL